MAAVAVLPPPSGYPATACGLGREPPCFLPPVTLQRMLRVEQPDFVLHTLTSPRRPRPAEPLRLPCTRASAPAAGLARRGESTAPRSAANPPRPASGTPAQAPTPRPPYLAKYAGSPVPSVPRRAFRHAARPMGNLGEGGLTLSRS